MKIIIGIFTLFLTTETFAKPNMYLENAYVLAHCTNVNVLSQSLANKTEEQITQTQAMAKKFAYASYYFFFLCAQLPEEKAKAEFSDMLHLTAYVYKNNQILPQELLPICAGANKKQRLWSQGFMV